MPPKYLETEVKKVRLRNEGGLQTVRFLDDEDVKKSDREESATADVDESFQIFQPSDAAFDETVSKTVLDYLLKATIKVAEAAIDVEQQSEAKKSDGTIIGYVDSKLMQAMAELPNSESALPARSAALSQAPRKKETRQSKNVSKKDFYGQLHAITEVLAASGKVVGDVFQMNLELQDRILNLTEEARRREGRILALAQESDLQANIDKNEIQQKEEDLKRVREDSLRISSQLKDAEKGLRVWDALKQAMVAQGIEEIDDIDAMIARFFEMRKKKLTAADAVGDEDAETETVVENDNEASFSQEQIANMMAVVQEIMSQFGIKELDQIAGVREEMDRLRLEASMVQEKERALSQQLHDLREEFAAKTEENARLSRQVSLLSQGHETLAELNSRLGEQDALIGRLKAENLRYGEVEKSRLAGERKLSELNEQHEALKLRVGNFEELQRKLAALDVQLGLNNEKYADERKLSQDEAGKQRRTIAELQGRLRDQGSNNDALQAARAELGGLRVQLRASEARNAVLSAESEDLKARLAAALNERREAEGRHALQQRQLQQQNDALQQLQQQNDALQRQVVQVQQELAQANVARTAAEQELQARKDRVAAVKDRIAALRNAPVDNGAQAVLEQARQQREARMAVLQRELEIAIRQRDEAQEVAQRKDEVIARQQDDLQRLTAALSAAQARLQQQESRFKAMLEEKDQAIAALRSQLGGLTDERDLLNRRLEAQQAELEGLKAKNNLLLQEVEELRAKLAVLRGRGASEDGTESSFEDDSEVASTFVSPSPRGPAVPPPGPAANPTRRPGVHNGPRGEVPRSYSLAPSTADSFESISTVELNHGAALTYEEAFLIATQKLFAGRTTGHAAVFVKKPLLEPARLRQGELESTKTSFFSAANKLRKAMSGAVGEEDKIKRAMRVILAPSNSRDSSDENVLTFVEKSRFLAVMFAMTSPDIKQDYEELCGWGLLTNVDGKGMLCSSRLKTEIEGRVKIACSTAVHTFVNAERELARRPSAHPQRSVGSRFRLVSSEKSSSC